jgi:hypothetical protein
VADTSMADLASYFRPIAEDLIEQAEASGCPVTVINTLRTPAQQAINIANGVSWTTNSKHLPQPPEMLSEAIDLCPTEYLTEKGWCPGGRLWSFLGAIGKSKGLRWGGDWPQKDLGHFELIHEPVQLGVDESTQV